MTYITSGRQCVLIQSWEVLFSTNHDVHKLDYKTDIGNNQKRYNYLEQSRGEGRGVSAVAWRGGRSPVGRRENRSYLVLRTQGKADTCAPLSAELLPLRVNISDR